MIFPRQHLVRRSKQGTGHRARTGVQLTAVWMSRWPASRAPVQRPGDCRRDRLLDNGRVQSDCAVHGKHQCLGARRYLRRACIVPGMLVPGKLQVQMLKVLLLPALSDRCEA